MSDRMDIRESDAGIVRVFHLDLPPEAIERFTVQAGTGEWPLLYGLGAKKLSASFIDVVRIRDLEDMPLTSYLHQAHGIPEDQLRDNAGQLNRLRGHVLILPSQAFAHTAQSLTIRTPLRWVGTFQEIRPTRAKAPLRSKSARGSIGGGRASARSGPGLPIVKLALAAMATVVILGIAAVYLAGG
ncbi:aspartate carbamoyltransferase catalytic subunit [Mesobacterium sp. TK19101]|uniref:Aspartate carbamoyltransferase catalytic subunit n=1 Tax=Mesobacterium hydrothermale TaxID=3111907 RepID=A0ABU6HLG7_9RHOB|nr:aspartate carbamoyltransferase catalytic subunit [Mesobacterium sp. TK19101]MEC3862734.1 aspartate carbamoyltransferase catalytic subunit [Mesobacterium sp. TK19101]